MSKKEKILAIIKENAHHAHLATIDGDQPRVRSVTPIVEDDMTIWITTFTGSRKMQQLKENSKICLQFVEHPAGEKEAIVIGEAEIVKSIEEKKKIWDLAPFDPSLFFPGGPESEEFSLLKIKIKNIEWRESMQEESKIYEP